MPCKNGRSYGGFLKPVYLEQLSFSTFLLFPSQNVPVPLDTPSRLFPLFFLLSFSRWLSNKRIGGHDNQFLEPFRTGKATLCSQAGKDLGHGMMNAAEATKMCHIIEDIAAETPIHTHTHTHMHTLIYTATSTTLIRGGGDGLSVLLHPI
jgi:hypothetical protein